MEANLSSPSLLSRLQGVRQTVREGLREPSSRIPKVIAVCNQKGGCGKTTTSINLAAALGLSGYQNLLVDLDPQAHASLGLGVDTQHLTHTVYDVFQDSPHRRGLEEVILPTKVSNLWVAPANFLLSGSQLELATVFNREQVLSQAIQRLGARFEYLFIDCSPSLNLLTINALTAADFCLVPLQPHYYALEGMKELFTTIELIQERFNPRLRLLGILPVLYDGRSRIVREILGQIQEYFKEQVFQTMIRYSVKLVEASVVGQPVVLYAPRSAGGQDYMNFSREVLTRINELSVTANGNYGTTAATVS